MRRKLFVIPVLLMFWLNIRAEAGPQPQVPMLDDGGMPEIPVQVAGRTLYFLIDTGFSVSAIDARNQDLLGSQTGDFDAVSPLGTKKQVPLFRCPPISVAGEVTPLDQVACLDLQMLTLIGGRQCDGILGMDWFAKNIVAIDFDRKTFTIEDQEPVAPAGFDAVPLDPMADYFAVNAFVNQVNPVVLMIDTGNSSSLSLNQRDWPVVFSGSETNTVMATVADAVNQVARTRVGVVQELTVGGLDYSNLHAMFTRNPVQPSVLGLEFLQRHEVILDFPDRMLYLRPGRNFFAPDVEDMSGLHLIRDGGRTTVYSVDDFSPAAAQGIRASDIIETVNQQPATTLSMKNIRKILRSGDGVCVALQVRRGGNLLDIRLVLKKTI